MRDDTAAIQAAITAAGGRGVVTLPYRSSGYAIAGQLVLDGAVTLAGEGMTSLVAVGEQRDTPLITVSAAASGVTIIGLTIDGAGIMGGALVYVNGDDTTVERCTVTGRDAAGSMGVQIGHGTRRARIARNLFTHCHQGVYIANHNEGVRVEDNHIEGWHLRGIYAVGDATRASDDLRIERNRITDPAGTRAYPIHVAGHSARRHARLVVASNVVVGPGLPFAAGGTADQIAVFHAEDFAVVDNISTDGGDMGITIEGDSRRGVVSGNVCTRNESSGIDLGSRRYSAQAVTVTGNVCMNNGQNRSGETPADSRAGVRVKASSGIVISGNTLGDDQATPTQQYGVTFTDSTDCTCGPDVDAGNARGLYLNAANNARLRQARTVAL